MHELESKPSRHTEAVEFNGAAESYYRERLRAKHLVEAFDRLEADLPVIEKHLTQKTAFRKVLTYILDQQTPLDFVRRARGPALNESGTEKDLIRLINLLLLMIEWESGQSEPNVPHQNRISETDEQAHDLDASSIHRSAHR